MHGSRRWFAWCVGLVVAATAAWSGGVAHAQAPAGESPARSALVERPHLSRALGLPHDDPNRASVSASLELWEKIKDRNAEALRQVNRQQRVKNCDPNVILIDIDDLGYGDLGVYGQQRIRTPEIDRMAHEGVRYTNYYAGTSAGNPSRGALLTGLHTGHGRIRGNQPETPLEPHDFTLAEVMWEGGYDTKQIGRWSLGAAATTGSPIRQGFDAAFGYTLRPEARNHFPPFLWRNDTQEPLPGNADGKKEQLSHELFTDEVLEYLDRPRRHPYFLYLSFTLPHAELAQLDDVAPYDDEDWPLAQKRYAAAVTRVDASVGKILERLRDLERDAPFPRRPTIVLLTSDNGPHADGVDPDFFRSTGGLRGRKGSLYEGGIRVPMIVWRSDAREARDGAGGVDDIVWAAWDVLPTVADLGGVIRRPRGIDGVSFGGRLPPTASDAAPRREPDYLYWELHEEGFQQAIRQGRWKGIRSMPGATLELYDLVDDPAEMTNRAEDFPEIVARLTRLLEEARTPSPHWPAP